MPKGLIGRPPKLTPETQTKIVQAIAAGNYRQVAANHAGIHIATLYLWMELGERQKEGRYHDFLEAVKKADADAEASCVALIRKAALDGTWQAAAWFLERKHGDRWALKQKVDATVTGDPTKPLEVHIEALDEIVRRIAGIAARSAENNDSPQLEAPAGGATTP